MIDGHGYMYRAFYAIRGLSVEGQPTNAVYGFSKLIFRLLEDHRPDYLAVAFDTAAPTFRHRAFAAYKIERPPMPPDLKSQFPLTKKVIEALGIPVFEQEGFEADDFLGSLAKALERVGYNVWIVTGDKDMLQLVNDRIKVMSAHKEDLKVYDKERVRERWGVNPDQMPDVMALMGDAVDGIPGVSGVGEKTAAALIREHGSVKRLYEELDRVKNPRVRHALETGKDSASLSRSLATIKTDIELSLPSMPKWQWPKDLAPLRETFRRLAFTSLLNEVERLHSDGGDHKGDAANPRQRQQEGEMRTLTTLKAIHDVVKREGARATQIAVDLEVEQRRVRSFMFAFHGSCTYVIPLKVEGSDLGLSFEEGLKPFERILADPAVKKIGRRMKAFLVECVQRRLPCVGIAFDLELAEYVLGRQSRRTEDETSIRPAEVLSVYPSLEDRLESAQLDRLYHEVEIPLIPVLADMEVRGIAVNFDALEKYRRTLEGHLQGLEQAIHALGSGETFNVKSPQQVATELFERLKLPHARKGKRGYSTAVDVLEALAGKHPIAAKILEHRMLSKLMTGYVEALPELKHPVTGRIHSSWNQTVTSTGRLSSSDPNLQNIPIKTQIGKALRKVFVPSLPSWRLVSADYSQIELRILAHMSEDVMLMRAFEQGEDIHTTTATQVFGVPPGRVDHVMRRKAKAINFGLMYGMSPFGLAQELKISVEEAGEYIRTYFARFPRVRIFLEETLRRAKSSGYVSTLMGRRRYLTDLASPNRILREMSERAAINAPIQGSAADLIKLAMIRFARAIKDQKFNASLLLQVHDELVVECPNHELDHVKMLLKHIMEGVYTLRVPLQVNVETGKNWYEAS